MNMAITHYVHDLCLSTEKAEEENSEEEKALIPENKPILKKQEKEKPQDMSQQNATETQLILFI